MIVRSVLTGIVAVALLAAPASADMIIMGENSPDSSTNHSYSKGNVVSVDATMTLDTIGVYLTNVAAGTNVEWAVYEAPVIDGTYTQLLGLQDTVAGGSGYFDSGSMGVQLDPGSFYWLGGFWDQDVTYWFSNQGGGPPVNFPTSYGTMTYLGRKGAYSTFPGPVSFTGGPSSGATTGPYWQRYNIIPEPASLLILGLGMLVVTGVRRR